MDYENKNIEKFLKEVQHQGIILPEWWSNELSLKMLYTSDHKIHHSVE